MGVLSLAERHFFSNFVTSSKWIGRHLNHYFEWMLLPQSPTLGWYHTCALFVRQRRKLYDNNNDKFARTFFVDNMVTKAEFDKVVCFIRSLIECFLLRFKKYTKQNFWKQQEQITLQEIKVMLFYKTDSKDLPNDLMPTRTQSTVYSLQIFAKSAYYDGSPLFSDICDEDSTF